MPITPQQSITGVAGSGGNTIVLSPTSTPAGALIAITASVATTVATISGVTDNQGNTYARAVTNTASNQAAEVWRCPNAIGGVTAITVTFSANVTSAQAEASGFVFESAATSSELGQTSTGSGSANASVFNMAVTSFAPDETTSVIVVAGRISAVPTFTAGTDYTLGTPVNRHGLEYKIRTGAGNETGPMVATFGGSGVRVWVEVAAEFKAAAAGGGNRRRRVLLCGRAA